MTKTFSLPSGQYEIDDFPRFGLSKFARRFPKQTDDISIAIGGNIPEFVVRALDLGNLQRVEQIKDFHCVTTWSKRNLRWSGFRFAELYAQYVQPRVQPGRSIDWVLLRAQDGYQVGMQLDDLLAPDVLIVDSLNGEKLPVAHGAPVRLVAPAHYGYKNLKHLSGIEFHSGPTRYRHASLKFMDHPRARVDLEERGRYFPGWLLRRLYRPLVRSTIRTFATALGDYMAGPGKRGSS